MWTALRRWGAGLALLIATATGAIADDKDLEPLGIVTRDTASIGGPASAHAVAWTARTGRPVHITRLPFDQLYHRVVAPLLSDSDEYDVLLIPSGWLGDFAPYLTPVPSVVRDALGTDDVLPPYRDLGRSAPGDYVAVPIDGDMHIGAYRVDLFNDPANRLDFRREYGRELEPPETWDDYFRIATFFKGRKAPNGRILRGTLEAFHPAGQRIWWLFSHVAAYAVHRDARAAMFFDPDSMSAMIDTPAWVRALKEYLQARDLAGEDALDLLSADVRRLFSDGEAPMAIDWTDIGPLSAGPGSRLTGDQVAFFSLPGSRDVWNASKGMWERRTDGVNNVPYLAFGGWVAAVPAGSRRQEAAWDYIAWLAGPANSARDVMDGYSGINPYRRSHLVDSTPWLSVLSRDAADSYLRVIRDGLGSPVIALDLRVPGTQAYLAALDRQLDLALSGAAAPEDALRAAAAEWDFLTDRLGRSAQRRHYRTAMGLPE